MLLATIDLDEFDSFIGKIVNIPVQLSKLEFISYFMTKFNIANNIEFTKYYIFMQDHKDEFVVDYAKIIEFGIFTKWQLMHSIKNTLHILNLTENTDYRDMTADSKYCRPYDTNLSFTPAAFKKLLYRTKSKNKDSILSYYTILEEIHIYYNEYIKLKRKHMYPQSITMQINENNEFNLYCYEVIDDEEVKNNNKLPSMSDLLSRFV